jgi:virginiamycin A acetyltransferase
MKAVLKRTANTLALGIMLPAATAYWILARLLGRTSALPGWSQALSLLPGTIGAYLRRAFYGLVLPRCGRGCVISFGTIFTRGEIEIGENAYLGPYGCFGDISVGDDVLIGSHVSITNGSRQHGIERLDIPVREQPGRWPKIRIGRDSWIGDRAVVMADVGEHCVVGAGSVVVKPVPDFAIVVGSPAKIVSWRGAPRGQVEAADRPHEGRIGSDPIPPATSGKRS